MTILYNKMTILCNFYLVSELSDVKAEYLVFTLSSESDDSLSCVSTLGTVAHVSNTILFLL